MKQGNKGRKEFSLEEALAGKPVVTRDGRAVTQITKFSIICPDYNYPVYGVVQQSDGTSVVKDFTENGVYMSADKETDWDLFMAPEKKWTNLYYHPEKHDVVSGEICDSKEEALEFCTYNKGGMKYIDTISFNVEEDNK